MSNVIPLRPITRHLSWLAGDHILTNDGHVLRRSGKAGAHGTKYRPVAAHVAAKVLAGLSERSVR